MTTYRAPGKLFWIGEYAVLDGGPALVAAIDRTAVVTAEAAPRDVTFVERRRRVRLWDDRGPLTPPDVRGLELVAAVARAVADAGIRPPAMTLTATSAALSAGHKLGLGSSGAIASALTAALTEGLSTETRLDLALRAHAAFQGGVGSGADVVASCLGGLHEVRVGHRPRAVRLPDTLRHAAIVVGEPADTRALVRAYRLWRDAAPRSRQVVASLAETAQRGIDALDAADIDGWCGAVRAYAATERAMTTGGVPIVTAAVARCLDAAERAGWAAKPSGAGGGDIVVAFGGPGADREQLASECDAAGVELLGLSVAARGALGSD